jgi:hypothetical protein
MLRTGMLRTGWLDTGMLDTGLLRTGMHFATSWAPELLFIAHMYITEGT